MKYRVSRLLLASCSLSAAQTAFAQADTPAQDYAAAQERPAIISDPASQIAAVEPADTAREGEIIVTARRRSESLLDTPISVSALSGEQLERSGVTDVQALQYRTPSLSITSAQSQRNTVAFAIRGQRTQETQLFSDPPVGTYFGEVVQPRPYGFGQALYDLESVQVLKGVQGTLFGRNMTGGAVLVEPRHPRLGTLEGEIRGQYGKYDMRDLFAAVNVPLGDIAALRVAGKIRRRDGWAREATSGIGYDNQHYDTFRVSALIEPTDNIESLTVFDWFDLEENGTAAFLTAISFPSVLSNYENLRRGGLIDSNIPAQFEAAQLLRRNFRLDTGVGEGGNLDAFPEGPFERIRNWGIQNKTSWDITDNLTLKNIFGYRKLHRQQVQDYDGIPAFLITPFQFSRIRNISEELQLQGKAIANRLTYILGGYYFEEEGEDGALANTLPELNMIGRRLNARTTPALLLATQNPGTGYSRTAAAYAAGTFDITDEISFSAGLRYNYDKRKITVAPGLPNLQQCSFDIDAATPGLQTVPFDQCSFTNKKSFKEWTYDGTIQYEPSTAVTIYASYRRGFRAGGFSTRATSFVALQPFLPEFVDEYEIGLKTSHSLGDARLTTSAALFQQNGTNVQKQRATFVGGNVFTVVDNTAKQRNRGGEFEATLSYANLTLNAFYSYTKVDIQEGRVVLNGVPEYEQRGTPRHQLGGTLTVSPEVNPSLGKFNLIANVTYRSKIFMDDFELNGLQPAYGLFNLRAEVNNIGGSGFSAAIFGTNLTNTRYRLGTLGLIAEGLGFSSSVFGEPQMYGIEVGYKF